MAAHSIFKSFILLPSFMKIIDRRENYIQKGELPVKQDNSGKVITYEYNDTEMKNANDTSNSISLSGVDVKSLKNEFVLNGDYSNGEQIVSDTVFYALDLNKLNVEKTKRGTGNNGLDDVYVISNLLNIK